MQLGMLWTIIARSIFIALQYTSNKQQVKQESSAGLRWSEYCHYIVLDYADLNIAIT